MASSGASPWPCSSYGDPTWCCSTSPRTTCPSRSPRSSRRPCSAPSGRSWSPATTGGCGAAGPAASWRCEASPLALVDLLGHGREHRVEVADDAEVDELEDRRLLVLVDRDDRLGGLHAGPVLDGAGDAVGHVELRGDDLAGLADLEGVGVPPRVDGRTRGAHGRTQGVGQLLHRLEV